MHFWSIIGGICREKMPENFQNRAGGQPLFGKTKKNHSIWCAHASLKEEFAKWKQPQYSSIPDFTISDLQHFRMTPNPQFRMKRTKMAVGGFPILVFISHLPPKNVWSGLVHYHKKVLSFKFQVSFFRGESFLYWIWYRPCHPKMFSFWTSRIILDFKLKLFREF